MQMFGKPIPVMTIKLDGRKLAQVDIEKVKASLQNDGFFLQVPPPPEKPIRKVQRQKAQQKNEQ